TYLEQYLKSKVDLSKVKMIGITGTNGKTTSCFLTYQLLNLLKVKTAYIGTNGFFIDDKVRDLNNTTPDLYDLYMMFEEAILNDVKAVVMEVSSHALEQRRIEGIEFDIACYTNLTLEHIDYHKTMDNYLNAKLKLFDKLRNKKIAIINKDDPYSKYFISKDNHNITYGKEGTASILDYQLYLNKSIIKLKLDKEYLITLNLPCKYNIYNYMNALLIALELGHNIDEIIKLSSLLKPPKGRFDIVNYNSNVIVIDYAHTPDAVENILMNVEEYKENRIITILGCGGDRDASKRALMGKIAIDYSDFVIFTNDNPRNESEESIMKDIVSDLIKDNYIVIYDREEAIIEGIKQLKENDILLILGKGHEDYQIIGNEKIHFDDKEIVLRNIVNNKSM
ncbi:MAG: UDP-N-acetylmuramoyl-L-alanyl-D-glutamate--2,6-diaminopimelate ligase, partial [Bacilli bacterium]|nr:UDP-N-acetylmuramoyl-L-alanyl-D-glutamate--2,6-diaminopimelate ligase [Bacilli bacterium]